MCPRDDSAESLAQVPSVPVGVEGLAGKIGVHYAQHESCKPGVPFYAFTVGELRAFAAALAQQPAAEPVSNADKLSAPVGVEGFGSRAVAKELLRCFESWAPAVRVLGDVQAKDAADLMRRILAHHTAEKDTEADVLEGKPTEPGIYAVSGSHIGHPKDHAIVEVIERDGELLCNLHERNSDRNRWDYLADYGRNFIWHRIASPFAAAQHGEHSGG